MAEVYGTVTLLSGTGTKTVSLGMTPTSIHVWVAGKNGDDNFVHLSQGAYINGIQRVMSISPNKTTEPISGKIIQWRDASDVVVFEANWVAFPTGQVQFNVTTAPSTMPQVLLWARN